MSFTTVGFLSSDLKNWTTTVRSDHKAWFDLAEELNSACMQIMFAVHPLQSNTKQLVTSLLFGRALESFQGVILLVERGMIADARTLVRSCAESAIALGCVAVDDDFLDDLIAGNVKHRTTVANVLLTNADFKSEMDQAQIDKLQKLVDELKSNRSDGIKWEQAARKAGFLILYNTIYRETSGDAAHVTIDSLNRYIKTDVDQNIVGLSFSPETHQLDNTISAAICALLHSLSALEATFERADIGQVAKDFTAKWNELCFSEDAN